MSCPLGYAITMRGIPHSLQIRETSPADLSISGSYSSPKLMWMETASAPYFIASSTVVMSTLWFALVPTSVDADRCMISPTSFPEPR